MSGVPDKGDNIFYGGNKGWFTTDGEGFLAERSYMNDIPKEGCGLIALHDTMNYLIWGNHTFDYCYYEQSVYDLYDALGNAPHIRLFGLPILPVTMRLALEALNLEVTDESYHVRAIADSKDNLYDTISGSITKGYPVITCIFNLNLKIVLLNRDQSRETDTRELNLYTLSYDKGTTTSRSNSTNFHYVTITGIVSDDLAGDVFLRISSWGNQYYISLNELYDYCVINQEIDGWTFSYTVGLSSIFYVSGD